MPVAYASTGTQSTWGNGTTTVAHSHNITGNALIVSVDLGYYQQANPSVSASINGVPLTLLRQQNNWWASQGSQSSSIAVFGMLNPPNGPQTITLTVSNPNFYGTGTANSVSYSGVSSFGTVTTAAATGGAATVTSQWIPTGSMCFNTFQAYKYNASGSLTAYNQTTRANTSVAYLNSMGYLIGDAQGAGGKITFTATAATAEAWYGITVPLLEKPTATVKGVANAVLGTSVTIPSHSVGDLIVIFGYINGLNSAPTAPSASGTVPTWTLVQGGGGSTNGSGVWYFVATATNHTSGTWGSTGLIAVVIQGVSTASPIGGFAQFSVNGSSTAPAITQSVTDGSSCLLYFHGHRSNVTIFSAAPTGFTRQAAALGSSGICLNTKDDTTSDGAATQTDNGNGGSRGQTVEILAGTGTVSTVPTNQFFQMF